MTNITLLDGGIGQELVRRSGKPPAPRWSTQIMLDHPGLVSEVHQAYADAGATVATTNTYAMHRDRLRGGSANHYASADTDLPDLEAQLPDLLALGLAEADAVRARSRIAGAVGPLGASYRADVHPELEAAIPLYAEIVEVIAPRVDLILFETIASVTAARACLAAGRASGKPVWLAFTVDDEDGSRLRSGEAVAEAVDAAAEADALLANCSAPEAMPAALDALARAGVPFGAYANGFTQITKAFIAGGTTTSDLSARKDMTPERYAAHALAWVDQGATIIGGCCETGPEHIAEIARALRDAGHSIV